MKKIVAAFDIGIGCLLTGAALIVVFSHENLETARLLLIAAAALVILRWIAWSLASPHKWWVRAFICAFVTAFVLIAMPPLLAWNGE